MLAAYSSSSSPSRSQHLLQEGSFVRSYRSSCHLPDGGALITIIMTKITQLTSFLSAAGFASLSYMSFFLIYNFVEERRYNNRHENQALEYSKKSGICCSCCEKLKYPKRDKDPSVKK